MTFQKRFEAKGEVAVITGGGRSIGFQAALALAEAMTLIAEGQVPGSIYDEAAAVLSANEIAAVEWLGVVINTWNRIAIPSRYSVSA